MDCFPNFDWPINLKWTLFIYLYARCWQIPLMKAIKKRDLMNTISLFIFFIFSNNYSIKFFLLRWFIPGSVNRFEILLVVRLNRFIAIKLDWIDFHGHFINLINGMPLMCIQLFAFHRFYGQSCGTRPFIVFKPIQSFEIIIKLISSNRTNWMQFQFGNLFFFFF